MANKIERASAAILSGVELPLWRQCHYLCTRYTDLSLTLPSELFGGDSKEEGLRSRLFAHR